MKFLDNMVKFYNLYIFYLSSNYLDNVKRV